jgi:hypothetical protein
MAHDCFISYSSKDKATADAACATLEAAGIRCWIAPRDILAGMNWGGSIIKAIGDSAVMVLIFSGNSNASEQVKREVERASSKGVPIIPFRIEAIAPSPDLEYFISTPHWLDAMTPPLAEHLGRLARTVAALLAARDGPGATTPAPAVPAPSPPLPSSSTPTSPPSNTTPPLAARRPLSKPLAFGVAGVVLIAAVGVTVVVVNRLARPGGDGVPINPTPSPPVATLDRTDPTSTAKAIIQAYRDKDLAALAALSNGGNKTMLTEIATRGPSHSRYESMFAGWRWDAVQAWDGRIGTVRYRELGGVNPRLEARAQFGTIGPDEVLVVTMISEDGRWCFEDVHSTSVKDFAALGTTLPTVRRIRG